MVAHAHLVMLVVTMLELNMDVVHLVLCVVLIVSRAYCAALMDMSVQRRGPSALRLANIVFFCDNRKFTAE